MSIEERQQQFKAAIEARPDIPKGVRIAENFGFSNSSRVIQGGLFTCTSNLDAPSRKLLAGDTNVVSGFVPLCVLTFPPQDEVYFAINVAQDVASFNHGLLKLAREAEEKNKQLVKEGKKEGGINNNIKFYLTEGGNLYFHNNDFKTSIDSSALDPDCLVRVDAVWFSIWPPAVSASRSVLAREFVGYLGNLVGKDKVHELTVWPDADTLSPAMRRMPRAIPLQDIESAIEALGGYYPNGEIAAYHTALNFLSHKHFVILSGISGTGKTKLALEYAMAVHGLTDRSARDPLRFVCAVRPEWTDPSGLTGYYDRLSGCYVVPDFLQAVLVATAHRDSPVFVVLDEMNLARVEYYLSDVLSCVETQQPLQLHAEAVPVEGTTGTSIRASLPLPPNLYITGTINIDETTHPVSDKVLDRAVVIDMSDVRLEGFLGGLIAREPSLAPAHGAAGEKLTAVHTLLAPHALGFGYRLAEEAIRYYAFAAGLPNASSNSIVDAILAQKVLVKLRGGEPQRKLLTDLARELAGLPKSTALLERLMRDLDEYGSFQASR